MAWFGRLQDGLVRIVAGLVRRLVRARPGSFRAVQVDAIVSSLATLATSPLRRALGRGGPLTAERVERKYDHLSGSYIATEASDRPRWAVVDGVPALVPPAALQDRKADAYAEIIARFAPATVCEVGAGELTTLARVALRLREGVGYTACDLSGPRIDVGREHFTSTTGLEVDAVKANAVDLPYADGSFDVVFTSHCLEHMPLDYEAALDELVRVARTAVVLFEPCYEYASRTQRLRMRAQGYVRGLLPAVQSVTGFRLAESGELEHGNPFNRTSYFVLVPSE